jgi:UDP-N-acetylglucosamine--N-acetylmuramyl-(pentapeptide) pyrophosphoryl-undecaprenol N-acetylglucosamine transferase
MAWGVAAGRRLLRRLDPVAVLALGGWPCAPTAIAALTRGIPLHLIAVDAVPGVVVRKLQRRAAWTWLAFEEARKALPAPDRATVVGPIVRRAVAGGHRDPARFGFDPGRRTLLVLGGSLGARGLNERVREGLAAALRGDPSLAGRLQVLHSTGTEEDAARCAEAYRALGLLHDVRPFVPEVGDAMRTADLVVSRGGASTLAELRALGRPVVVVPYPHHEDRQQWRNAAPLVERGQAEVVEEGSLDPARFREAVVGRLLDADRLRAMERPPAAPEGVTDPATTIALALVRSIRDAGGPS